MGKSRIQDSIHPYLYTYIIIWDLGHDESRIRDMGEVTDTEKLQTRVTRQPPGPGNLEH